MKLQLQFEERIMLVKKNKEKLMLNHIINSESLFQSLLQKAFKGELVS